MKRNPDLLKKILEIVEESEDEVYSEELKIEGATQAQIDYHIELLKDVDFIELEGSGNIARECFTIQRLTMRGHDFLDAARNENAWKKTKEIFAASGGFVLKLAEPLLLDLIKQQLGLLSAP